MTSEQASMAVFVAAKFDLGVGTVHRVIKGEHVSQR